MVAKFKHPVVETIFLASLLGKISVVTLEAQRASRPGVAVGNSATLAHNDAHIDSDITAVHARLDKPLLALAFVFDVMEPSDE